MARARSSETDPELYKRLSISRVDLGLMTRQLAVLLGSGLELRQSLEALGAGAGGVLGAIDEDGDALGGAVIGALAGAATGVTGASEKRAEIVLNCLRGRGHAIVG